METTIRLNTNVKDQLDKFKIHVRESYNEVLMRILKECKRNFVDEESLKETIEILSDPETLRDLAEANAEFERRETTSWEKIKKDLKLNV